MARTQERTQTPPPPPSRSRSFVAPLRAAVIPVLAVVVALVIGAIIIAVSGSNPLVAYGSLLQASLGNARGITRTLERATPLIFGGLAVSFAFKAGLFNIGAQGQLLFGAIMAAFIGFSFKDSLPLPGFIHIPFALLVGALCGAIWAGIAGVLRAYSGAHEVITTIMLNYIAFNLTDFLANGPWKDRSPGNIVARTPAIAASAKIPVIGSVPIGVLLAIVVAVLVWWLIERTTFGFELRTVGQNPNAAQYAGISVKRIILLAMAISGLLAGMGGAVETLGVIGRYQPGFNAGLGFTAITIALLARTHPLGVIPAALLIGAMQAGANRMQIDAKVAPEIIDVVQALMLFFIAADVVLRKLLHLRRSGEKVSLSGGWGASS